MASAKADIRRWARGHQLAQRRISEEARVTAVPFAEALGHVDDLRELADTLGAKVSLAAARRENLAFHLTWARVRRVFGVG